MLSVEWKHSGAIAGKPHERPEATQQALCHLLGLVIIPLPGGCKSVSLRCVCSVNGASRDEDICFFALP
ncbi:hypothetical protein GJ496_003719 [Pomphorhynchus laevis]|nr:hypothetical protein GJ496_003719 [Pomphorhynchus laevis]